MNEQQKIYDELKNIVINLNKVIPALQNLSSTTADSFNETLSESVRHIDLRLKNLMQATVKLEDTTKENVLFIQSAERQAVNHVKNGVEKLITTNVSFEYQEQIAEVIERLEPLIYKAINEEIKRLGNIQQVSIESKNTQLTELKETVKTDINEVIGELSTAINSINELSKKIKVNAEEELNKLNELSTAHTDTLTSIEEETDSTLEHIYYSLQNIKELAISIQRTPVFYIVSAFAFLNFSFLIALAYKFQIILMTLAVMGINFGIILIIFAVFAYIKEGKKKGEKSK